MEEVSVNWSKVAEVFDIPEEYLKYLHEHGTDCPQCGEHLDTFGAMIKHEHSFDVEDIVEVSPDLEEKSK